MKIAGTRRSWKNSWIEESGRLVMKSFAFCNLCVTSETNSREVERGFSGHSSRASITMNNSENRIASEKKASEYSSKLGVRALR